MKLKNLIHEICRANNAETIYHFELALQAPVMEMMMRGFRVDPFARELGLQTCTGQLERLNYLLQRYSNALTGSDVNPRSGPQLRHLFYDCLGIKPIIRMDKGEPTMPMNRQILELIENHFEARPIVRTILDIRDITKQMEVLQTEVDNDWRMRTSYNIGGTNEARFSASKSATGSGRNLQNITEELRHIFVPDPGWKLYGFDLEQSDSRAVGWMCGILFNDWSYLDACESGDLHSAVARMVWGEELPWTGDQKKDRAIADREFYYGESYRQWSKKLGHGTNFFGKARTMSAETHIPILLVEQFMEKYFGAFPCLLQWQHWTAAQLQTHRRLTNIFGRTRDFFDRPESDETLKQGLAFLAASVTADYLNLGLWRVWKHMPDVQLLLQLHDALYFQAKEAGKEYEADVVKRCQQLMTIPFRHNSRQFIIPTEGKCGWNWGQRWGTDSSGNKVEVNEKGLDKIGAQRN